ncbi:MAG: antitoxin [Acidobacteriota bacterium]
MRTTLTLEPDVAEKLKRAVRQRKLPMKTVVNDLLRSALKAPPTPPREPFVVKPFNMGGFAPGINPNKLNQLLDDMEIEEFLRKQARDRT